MPQLFQLLRLTRTNTRLMKVWTEMLTHTPVCLVSTKTLCFSGMPTLEYIVFLDFALILDRLSVRLTFDPQLNLICEFAYLN